MNNVFVSSILTPSGSYVSRCSPSSRKYVTVKPWGFVSYVMAMFSHSPIGRSTSCQFMSLILADQHESVGLPEDSGP